MLFALIVAIPVHEFSHARSAVSNGDDGPRRDGRLTLFPWDHFDPVGALFCMVTVIVGFGIGWGKPVLVNPSALRNPRWDMVKISAWGPFSNLLLAIGFGLPLRFGLVSGPMAQLLFVCMLINLFLMFFNLIPIYPLDGSKILEGFLPEDLAFRYSRFMQQFGMMLLFGLLIFGRSFGVLDALIGQPAVVVSRVILGF